jgi:hypothetical protein
MRMKNIIKTVAMGAILAVSGFAQAQRSSGSAVAAVSAGGTKANGVVSGNAASDSGKNKDEPKKFEPQYNKLHGGSSARLFDHDKEVSVDEVAFKMKNFKEYYSKEKGKAQAQEEAFYIKTLSKEKATIDRSAVELNADIKEVIAKVAKLTKSQQITEATVVERHPFWLTDSFGQGTYTIGSRAGKDYWYKYFEFKKHKVKVVGEQDDRFYHSLTIYSIDVEKEQAEADRVFAIEERNKKEGRNDPTHAKAEDHLHLKTHNYVLDAENQESGNGNDGLWFDKKGNRLELEGRN